MSGRAGGEVAKFGERFEGRWTVRQLLYVLIGDLEGVQVEPFDELADSVEFYATDRGAQAGHQAKRQRGRQSGWTLSALETEGILDAARKHVGAGRSFHFVSTIPAPDLDALTDKARRADDLTAMRGLLTSRDLVQAFDRLAGLWGSPEEALRILRAVFVGKPDERDLHKTNLALARFVIDGPPEAAVAVLAAIVLDTLAVTLTHDRLWTELETRGLKPARWRGGPAAATAVRAARERWQHAVRAELLQPEIARLQAGPIAESLAREAQRLMVLGAAGAGKTAVLSQVVASLPPDMPVLALRLDGEVTAADAAQLGTQLGLPASPAATLAAVAAGGPSVLLVDQLDAVSLVSGRLPERFEVFEELLREAAAFPQMRVVIACRRFDLENDPRLAGLIRDGDPTPVSVEALTADEVDAAVAAMRLDAGRLTAAQRRLLGVPLHLVLLAAVAGDADALDFDTTTDLLDRFYAVKRREVRARRTPPPRFEAVIGTLADYMSEHQRLSAPKLILDGDDLGDDADALISAHVIAQDRGAFRFFHEAFFDYAFARRFMATGQSLMEFLLAGEQELFRRAQVRQVLTLLRDTEHDRFVGEVGALLHSPDVRFHIKEVVIALLRALPDPTAQEEEMIAAVIEGRPELRERLGLMLRTEAWFERLTASGRLQSWLRAEGVVSERAAWILVAAAKTQGADVAKLLMEHADDERSDNWLRAVTFYGSLAQDRELIELVLAGVRRGVWDGHDRDLWGSASELDGQHPEWAVELLAAWLVERPDVLELDAAGELKVLQQTSSGITEVIGFAARQAPELFCRLLLPWLRQVMQAGAREDGHRPVRDRHFSDRFYGRDRREIATALFEATVDALRLLADDNRSAHLRELIEPLAADRFQASQNLLYEALTAAGTAHADWAADLLLEGPSRLSAGFVQDWLWTTRELLQATSPHMDSARFAAVEKMIVGFEPPEERSRVAREFRGRSSWVLLTALDRDRLADSSRRRLLELQRRLGDAPAPPTAFELQPVVSPIDEMAAERMSDANWLQAIARHAREENPDDWLRGGAPQLANVLAAETAKEPVRFARLALQIDAKAHPAYAEAVLRGLAEAPDAPADAVFDVIRHVAELGQHEHDRALPSAFRRLLDDEIPADVLEIVIDRALNSPSPQEERWQASGASGGALWGGSPWSFAINTARGANVVLLGDLVIRDGPQGQATERVLSVLPQLLAEPSLAVRTAVAHVLGALTQRHRGVAVDGFYALIEDVGDEIFTARTVENLTAAVADDDPVRMGPVLDRMRASTLESVRQAAGRLLCFLATENADAVLLERLVAEPDATVRLGVAEVLAARLVRAPDRDAALAAVAHLMRDPAATVSTAAAEFVVGLRDADLAPFEGLIEQLIASPAYDAALPQLLITFETANGPVDRLVIATAERFVEEYGSSAASIANRAAADARELSNLLMRAYAQADQAGRKRLLDTVDKLLLAGAYGVGEAVAEVER